MATLLEIGKEMEELERFIQEQADGELTAEIEAKIDGWLVSIRSDFENKADGYCGLIREMEMRASARQDESDRMARLAQADANAAKRLKDRLKLFMTLHGIRIVETNRFRIRVQANGGKVPLELLVPVENIPPLYQRQRIEADLEKIRIALEGGENLEFAALRERGTQLRII